MSALYILQNQHGYYLKKTNSKQDVSWVDGQDANLLFRSAHKDEALNMLIEVNSQHIDLRIIIKDYPANPKNHPLIPADELPPPLPKEGTETTQDSLPLSTDSELNQETDVIANNT